MRTLATLLALMPVGVVMIVSGDVALGVTHLIVLPLVAWSTWRRLQRK